MTNKQAEKERICINCHHRRFAGFMPLPEDSISEMGNCHLNPPNTEGRFPIVKPFFHCSFFKKIKRKIRKRMKTQFYTMPKQ